MLSFNRRRTFHRIQAEAIGTNLAEPAPVDRSLMIVANTIPSVSQTTPVSALKP
jgi:hypothetical protein